MEKTVGFHEMLNHLGEKIRVTQRTLRELDKCHYLRRDKESGLLQMKPYFFKLFLEVEGGDRPSFMFKEVGRDFRGLNVVNCKCKECQRAIAQTDNTHLPGSDTMTYDDVDRLIRDMMLCRRYA